MEQTGLVVLFLSGFGRKESDFETNNRSKNCDFLYQHQRL